VVEVVQVGHQELVVQVVVEMVDTFVLLTMHPLEQLTQVVELAVEKRQHLYLVVLMAVLE
tara:strand:- start:26 stop:205 length:180 start_codon:yes stop_codon:yes gene_type:complete